MSVDVSTLLWVAATLLGIVTALIGTIWALTWKSIDRIRKNVEDLALKLDEERKERLSKHDLTVTRTFSEIEKNRDKIHDIEVTVASFGAIYVTREEARHEG